MQRLQSFLRFLFLATTIGLLSACAGEPSLDKAIIGIWIQETPVSITDRGLQTTTTDTILRFKKNGETHLSRNLDIIGQGLPESGIQVSVELRGRWEFVKGNLRQTPDSVLIIPRGTDEESRHGAEKLQEQAEKNDPSMKSIVIADKAQLILQDVETGATDVYIRK